MAEEIGFGFIAVAIVSDILILCKSFKGPVLAGECGKWSLMLWVTFLIASVTLWTPDNIPWAIVVFTKGISTVL